MRCDAMQCSAMLTQYMQNDVKGDWRRCVLYQILFWVVGLLDCWLRFVHFIICLYFVFYTFSWSTHGNYYAIVMEKKTHTYFHAHSPFPIPSIPLQIERALTICSVWNNDENGLENEQHNNNDSCEWRHTHTHTRVRQMSSDSTVKHWSLIEIRWMCLFRCVIIPIGMHCLPKN